MIRKLKGLIMECCIADVVTLVALIAPTTGTADKADPPHADQTASGTTGGKAAAGD